MLTELQKLQSSTADLPASFQKSFPDLNANIQSLRETITAKDLTLNEKAHKIATEVRDGVNPLLEAVQQRVRELIGVTNTKKDAAKEASVKVEVTTDKAN